MILQYNVRVIVQVTQFREGNTVSLHRIPFKFLLTRFPCIDQVP